jgi:hypothetical protein
MTILNEATLAVLMTGFAHHVDIGQPTVAVISYPTTSEARMTLPNGTAMTGHWHLLPDGYHVNWTGGPAGTWQIDHAPGQLTYIDPTGRRAGTVTRIEPLPA